MATEQREEALQVIIANAEKLRKVLEDSMEKPKEMMKLSKEVGKWNWCHGRFRSVRNASSGSRRLFDMQS